MIHLHHKWCAEQQVPPSNLTKYYSCHEKWFSWNVIYNAWSNRCHCPTSPNTAPATKNDNPKNVKEIGWKQMKCNIYNARPIREWSAHDPSMKPSVRNPRRNRGYFSRSSPAFCMEKSNISRSGYHSKFHRILRLPWKVTLELHQILRLPRKITVMIHPRHTWNAIYNARRSSCHPPTSPNTGPARKDETWTWPNTAPATTSHTWTSPNTAPATKSDT